MNCERSSGLVASSNTTRDRSPSVSRRRLTSLPMVFKSAPGALTLRAPAICASPFSTWARANELIHATRRLRCDLSEEGLYLLGCLPQAQHTERPAGVVDRPQSVEDADVGSPGMREGISDCLDLPGVGQPLSLHPVCLLRRETLHRSQDVEVLVQKNRKVTHIEIVEDILMGVGNDTGDSRLGTSPNNYFPGSEPCRHAVLIVIAAA